MKTHKDLDVWKKSIDFVVDIYQVIKRFPLDEKYALANQIKRAAVSISSNIAEGAARSSDKEFLRFLYYSMGSLSELETLQNYVNDQAAALIDESETLNYTPTVTQNETGFSALMAGMRNQRSGAFSVLEEGTFLWSSTDVSSDIANLLFLSHSDANVIFSNSNNKNDGTSIRCIYDNIMSTEETNNDFPTTSSRFL